MVSSQLSNLIVRLSVAFESGADYIKSIRDPSLLISSLKELNELIGNDKVKDSIAAQISHLISVKARVLSGTNIKEDTVMLNTVLYGPPGVGKTLIGTKLAKIWYSLGYLTKPKRKEGGYFSRAMDYMRDNPDVGQTGMFVAYVFILLFLYIFSFVISEWEWFTGSLFGILILITFLLSLILAIYWLYLYANEINSSHEDEEKSEAEKALDKKKKSVSKTDEEMIKIVSRADLVDKYVGWSDKKTLKVLNESLGKVLFIDEAYSLVTDERDIFGVEVVNTINLFLSQHPNEIIVIMAGYKEIMERGLFSYQPGFRRRFMWQFDCEGYNAEELLSIFKLQLNRKGWTIMKEKEILELFRLNQEVFTEYGGDTEKLTFFSELEYSTEFIDNRGRIREYTLSPLHVRKGIAKLKENKMSVPPAATAEDMGRLRSLFETLNHPMMTH